jgi:hypothetical protein
MGRDGSGELALPGLRDRGRRGCAIDRQTLEQFGRRLVGRILGHQLATEGHSEQRWGQYGRRIGNASRFALAAIGILREHRIGREKVLLNPAFIDLLKRD